MPYYPGFQVATKIERRDGELVVALPREIIEYLNLSEGDNLAFARGRNQMADIWKESRDTKAGSTI